MKTEQPIFKILSIDGGGVRGIIPARILQAIEEAALKPIHELFDLIVGTSTGGLIALGLTCPNSSLTSKPSSKYTAKDILAVYMNSSPQIFKRSFMRKILTGWNLWGSKYERASYDTILQNLFEDTYLSAALCPVVTATYSLSHEAPKLFSSRLCKDHANPADYFMRDIAGATSAAPTYFPPKIFIDTLGNTHMDADGAIYANNPESIAVSEAYKLFPTLKREDIRIISLGSGSPKLTQSATQLSNAGVIGWVMKANLIGLMMDADSAWYNDEISTIYPNSLRLGPTLPSELAQIDNTTSENLQGLLQLAEGYLESNPNIIQQVLKLCTKQDTSGQTLKV